MNKYALLIHGQNFLMRDIGSRKLERMGFYVTACIEAETAEQAQATAQGHILEALKKKGALDDAASTVGKLTAENTAPRAEWPENAELPLSGFVFFNEKDDAEVA